MKKLILFLSILCLVGCEGTTKNNFNKQTEGIMFEQVREFTYKGHDYIWFARGYKGGVTHNPDCKKCFQAYD